MTAHSSSRALQRLHTITGRLAGPSYAEVHRRAQSVVAAIQTPGPLGLHPARVLLSEELAGEPEPHGDRR